MLVIEKGTTFIWGYNEVGAEEVRKTLTATKDCYSGEIIHATDFVDQDGNHPIPHSEIPTVIFDYVERKVARQKAETPTSVPDRSSPVREGGFFYKWKRWFEFD